MADGGHGTTIRTPRTLSETRTEQTRDVQSLIVGTAELRRSTADLHSEASALDESVLQLQVDDRASELAQEEVGDLLSRARADFGLSWEELAGLIGVSSAALRKWRRGEAVSPQNRHALARVLAFCEFLGMRDPRIVNPAQWLAEPFTSDTDLRAADLYCAGFGTQLMSVARGAQSRAALLDQFDPNWRTTHAASTRWQVGEGPEGLPTIAERERT
jgi:transcriptional regulator with XRE-family HTH domain